MYIINSYKECQKIFKKYSKSYYLGALLFNFNEFKHICAFHALVRYVDNIVDSDDDISLKKKKLKDFEILFYNIYNEYWKINILNKDKIKILPAVFNTINSLKLPIRIFQRFFNSMKLDLIKYSYHESKSLKRYTDGSSEVVCEVMLYIMSHKNTYYKKKMDYLTYYSKKLGESFQMTNFIRDIKEDFNMNPSRVYLPIKQFNITTKDLVKYSKYKKVNYKFKRFVKRQIIYNRNLYSDADNGIHLLEPRHREAIRISRILYSGILIKIEDENYNLFKDGKIKLGFIEKIIIIYNNLSLFNFIIILFNYWFYSILFYTLL